MKRMELMQWGERRGGREGRDGGEGEEGAEGGSGIGVGWRGSGVGGDGVGGDGVGGEWSGGGSVWCVILCTFVLLRDDIEVDMDFIRPGKVEASV